MYGTYWAARGSVDPARRILDTRHGQVIAVRDADTFFSTLEDQVRALERMAAGTALTAAVAASRVKNYIVDERRRIDLHDLAQEEMEKLIGHLGVDHFPVTQSEAPPYNEHEYLGRLEQYQALAENALAIIATGARWGRLEHVHVWTMMIDRLLNRRYERSGIEGWLYLQKYPAQLLLYAAGIGTLAGAHNAGDRDVILVDLLTRPESRVTSPTEPAYWALMASRVVDHDMMRRVHRQRENQIYISPISKYLFDRLRAPLRSLISDDALYARYFDRYEYLTALIQAPSAEYQ